MSNQPLSEEELRQWVLSLPPSSIRSLEDALKGIRDCNFNSVEENIIKNDGDSIDKDKSELMVDIDVSPPSRATSSASSNISVQSRSKSGKTYENGRRNLKEEDVPTDEAIRRAKRRERNRLAAAKCRKRRQDKIDSLQQRITQLRTQMEEINTSIDQYNSEQERLNSLLVSHKCTLNQQSNSGSATRPKDLHLEKTNKPPHSSSNVFICSLNPQLINLSPLFTPSTMKLLIDSINSQQSDATPSQPIKEESLETSVLDPGFLTSVSSSPNNFPRSLSLFSLLSPNADLLNLNILSDTSLNIAASLASKISSSSHSNQNQSIHFKHEQT